MGACEIMDGMEGANREHMFTLPCAERTTGKQMKLPSDELKTNTHTRIFWQCIIKFVELTTTDQ